MATSQNDLVEIVDVQGIDGDVQITKEQLLSILGGLTLGDTYQNNMLDIEINSLTNDLRNLGSRALLEKANKVFRKYKRDLRRCFRGCTFNDFTGYTIPVAATSDDLRSYIIMMTRHTKQMMIQHGFTVYPR